MKRNRVLTLVLALVVVVALFSPALASSLNRQATLNYRDIKITLDGKEVRPTDVNGNYVEPFIIDGTTYLSVRGVSSALGLAVTWDGKTSTVALSHPSDPISGYNQTPDVIFEKADTVKGLPGTPMYLDGTVTRAERLENLNVVYVDDGRGEVMMIQLPELSKNDLPTAGSSARVYYAYGGFSSVSGTPAGYYVGTTDYQNKGQTILDALTVRYLCTN